MGKINRIDEYANVHVPGKRFGKDKPQLSGGGQSTKFTADNPAVTQSSERLLVFRSAQCRVHRQVVHPACALRVGRGRLAVGLTISTVRAETDMIGAAIYAAVWRAFGGTIRG